MLSAAPTMVIEEEEKPDSTKKILCSLPTPNAETAPAIDSDIESKLEPNGTPSQYCEVISKTLDQITLHNSCVKKNKKSIFTLHSIPEIEVSTYLERIVNYMCPPEETSYIPYILIIMLIYLDRYVHYSNDLLNPYNIHRLLIASALLSCKFWIDNYYNNQDFSKIGGISLRELNSLEIEFFFGIRFDFFVSPKNYLEYKKEIETRITSLSNSDKPEIRPRSPGGAPKESDDPPFLAFCLLKRVIVLACYS